ncbi:MAG: helix-turn-helix domain-containing protein [Abditibacteriota bacterium]|nr:helix-turn-helix domain-containing protein [Abditibacteriota bacterium]
MPDFMDISDMEALLPYSRSSIYRYAVDGKIPCVKSGRRVMFRKDVIDQWSRTQTEIRIGNACG